MEEPTLTESTVTESTTPAPTPTATTTPAPKVEPTFTAEQQAEVDRRVAAARRKAEQDAKDAAATAAAEAEAKAKAEADIKADEERGAYNEAKAKIEQERDDALAESVTHKERLDTAIAAIKPGVDTRWTDLPDEIKAFYEGADDDVLAMAAFLDKSAAAVAKLDGKAKERPGMPRTPKPNPDHADKVTSPVTAKQITG